MTTKRIVVIGYSQSGQLARVLDRITAPLIEAGHRVERHAIRCAEPYPFPWPFWRFLDTMPETVCAVPCAIEPLRVEHDEPPDLVILGYPVWFLSLPPPLLAFLRSALAPRLLHGRAVITVTACRNMWIGAQQRMLGELRRLGARHLDHVLLTDRSGAFASFVTTPRWMFTGRRDAFWGFPAAGVSDEDILASARFGRAIACALAADRERGDGPLLTGLAACRVDERLIASERAGSRSFLLWAKLLRACGEPGAPLRRAMLGVYAVFLVCLILTVVPAGMLANAIARPFRRATLAAEAERLEGPSGSGAERMGFFAEAIEQRD